MVHNGIEYADMQLIAEAYDLLRRGAGLIRRRRSAEIFGEWNKGDLESFLIEITAEVLRPGRRRDRQAAGRRDPGPAEQKGTGTWTVQTALDLGVPVAGDRRGGVRPRAAPAARSSGRRPARRCRARPSLAGRGPRRLHRGRPAGAVRVEDRRLRAGLRPDRGRRRSEYGWNIDVGAMARIWRGGCIIRASS